MPNPARHRDTMHIAENALRVYGMYRLGGKIMRVAGTSPETQIGGSARTSRQGAQSVDGRARSILSRGKILWQCVIESWRLDCRRLSLMAAKVIVRTLRVYDKRST